MGLPHRDLAAFSSLSVPFCSVESWGTQIDLLIWTTTHMASLLSVEE